MIKKIVVSIILLIISIPTITFAIPGENRQWWDNNWSYKQEIIIPIDTSLPECKSQPIDIRIKFEEPCWAIDEKEHSVRVIFNELNNLIELESQIYDLVYFDDEHISECSLVFIIPQQASGMEKYYVYYDEKEKTGPGYPDRVQIEETYYRYELMPGYFYESYCYKITENGYIVYAIAQKGNVLGIGTSQQVMKFKPKSEKLMPSNSEAVAFFDFWYYYDKGNNDYKSTCQKLISKEIYVNGNLMVNCEIISKSNEEDMGTTANYKYYYCPKEDKKIYAHIEHEVLKEGLVKTYDFYDGSYVSLQTGGVRSNTVKELNFGKILKYIHIYTEDDIVKEYPLYTDPKYLEGEWNIPILTTFDDIDLGEKAWACYDNGNTGVAHSLILGSTNVIRSGKDEKDGIQVQIYETGYPDLPGLENNLASFHLGRNSYEKDSSHDRDIPKGLKVELDVDFFSTQNGGYEYIPLEASVFQNLIRIMPEHSKKYSYEHEENNCYSLKTYVFFAPNFPFGAFLSTLTGKKFSYITGEIYNEGNLIQNSVAGRISFNQVPDIEDKKLIESVKSLFGLFDFKNFTIFKKVIFSNLQPGNYLVKIFRKNPFSKEGKKFIGYQFVNLTKDSTTNIICTPEGKIKFSITDQNQNGIENIKIILLDGQNIIAENITDKNGKVLITAPYKVKGKYIFKLFFKGFLLNEEQFGLGLFSPIEKTITTHIYDFEIKIIDTWGLPPGVKLFTYINSTKMVEEKNIIGETNQAGVIQFNGLVPEKYTFNINFKSEELQETILIPNEKEKIVIFPLEYKIKTTVYNARGNKLNNIRLEFSRDDKKKTIDINDQDSLTLNLPPGIYSTKIYSNNHLIGMQEITILSDRSLNFVTIFETISPIIIAFCGALFVLAALYFSIKKKNMNFLLEFLVIIVLTVSIVYPWWSQNGSTSEIQTSTSLYITPIVLVTIISSPTVIGGNLASLPDIFINAMNSVIIFTITSCIIIVLTFVTDKFQKKRLSQILIIISFLLLLASILIFSFSMSELANITVGSFIGEGKIETLITNGEKSEMIPTTWGPDIGFFLYSSTLFLLFLGLLLRVKNGSTNAN